MKFLVATLTVVVLSAAASGQEDAQAAHRVEFFKPFSREYPGGLFEAHDGLNERLDIRRDGSTITLYHKKRDVTGRFVRTERLGRVVETRTDPTDGTEHLGVSVGKKVFSLSIGGKGAVQLRGPKGKLLVNLRSGTFMSHPLRRR